MKIEKLITLLFLLLIITPPPNFEEKAKSILILLDNSNEKLPVRSHATYILNLPHKTKNIKVIYHVRTNKKWQLNISWRIWIFPEACMIGDIYPEYKTRELVVLDWLTNNVYIFNATDAKLLDYFHVPYANDLILSDLDKDSIDEIIIVAAEKTEMIDSNGFGWAVPIGAGDAPVIYKTPDYPNKKLLLIDSINATTHIAYILDSIQGDILYSFALPPKEAVGLVSDFDTFCRSSPVVDDLDNDGHYEIIIMGDYYKYSKKLRKGLYWYYLFLLTESGELKWYIEIPGDYPWPGPAVGDIDADGYKEIVASFSGGIYIIDSEGHIERNISIPANFTDSPFLADIDWDGKLEIVVATADPYSLVVIDDDGSLLWQYEFASFCNVAFADLDQDLVPEIIVSDFSGFLYVFDGNGSLLMSFFNGYEGGGYILAVDVDNDGDTEIVAENVLRGYDSLYCLEVSPSDRSSPWPFYWGDSRWCKRVLDEDFDMLPDYLESYLGLDSSVSDCDGDGALDGWELRWGFDPLNSSDGFLDCDGDGLPNSVEGFLRTSPFSNDSDLDGLPDFWEYHYGTNAIYNDSYLDYDQDGLTNLEEFKFGSDPFKIDSDGDFLEDDLEVKLGFNPAWSLDGYLTEVALILSLLLIVNLVRKRKTSRKVNHKSIYLNL